MGHKELKSGCYSVHVNYSVNYVIVRSMNWRDVVFSAKISRYPKFLERISPDCYDGNFILTPQTEEIFKARIKTAITTAMDIANTSDAKYKEERRIADEKYKPIYEREQELEKYIKTFEFEG